MTDLCLTKIGGFHRCVGLQVRFSPDSALFWSDFGILMYELLAYFDAGGAGGDSLY